jgi:hypothetical protein
MAAPAALLDECLDLALVRALTQRGFDVVSLLVVGPRGVKDVRVLERATELERVLITQNTDDFKAVHAAWLQQGRQHPGVIGLPQRGPLSRRALRAAMLLDWAGAQEYASRLFIWRDLQQLLERGVRLAGYSDADVQQALGRG